MADRSNPSKPSASRQHEPAMGASDSNSGGGNAGGAPDAETAMRIGDPAAKADVNADRAKLFPNAPKRPGGDAGDGGR